ncbi:MAG: SRPBCC family protein [Nitrospirae bacterium]|nr:SRPBCC family protein [Nitrospirota bacterium]MBI3351670.1 SRPBCC family protein [Nitrospirota bacterium]
MWSKTYSIKTKKLKADQVWKVWADVNQWHAWQNDIEYAKLVGEFKTGNIFLLKPKGGPKVTIELIKVEPNKAFTDLTRFPLARMCGSHEFITQGNEMEIKTTVSIEGFLSFLWRKLVAEDVAKGMKEQTEKLIERALNV